MEQNWVSEAFPVTCTKSLDLKVPHLTFWLSTNLDGQRSRSQNKAEQQPQGPLGWVQTVPHAAYRDLPLSFSSFSPSHLHSNKVIQQNDPDTPHGKQCGLVEITRTFGQRKLRVSESLNLLDITRIIMGKQLPWFLFASVSQSVNEGSLLQCCWGSG